MASKIDIANRALTKIGDDRIMDILDDQENAKVLNSMYDTVLMAELRARVWNFSVKRAALPALASVPAFGFTNEFQLPADHLRLIQVGEIYVGLSLSDYVGMSEAEFQVEGRKILTDFPAPLNIRYVSLVTDPGLYDALFVEAFACKLAMECCERLTQSNTKRQLAAEEYALAIRSALRADAIENPPQTLPDESWIMSRL
jgi:hypothetical protein